MGSNWQPIETAPKVGTILVFDPIYEEAEMAHWNHKEGTWTDAYDDIWIYSPTHWMPLPKVPTQQEVDSGN